MDTRNRVRSIWESIEQQRSARGLYGSTFPMNPPASEAMIVQRLQRALDMRLPKQLLDSLRVFNGMDHQKGIWLNSFIPLSIEGIIEAWSDDRRRESEAIDEGDLVVKFSYHIPVMKDSVAHREIYLDARDGSVYHYVVDGLYFDEYSFDSYLDFLTSVEKSWLRHDYVEWPA